MDRGIRFSKGSHLDSWTETTAIIHPLSFPTQAIALYETTPLRPYRAGDRTSLLRIAEEAFAKDPAYRALFGDRVQEGLHFLVPRLFDMRCKAGATVHVKEIDGEIAGFLMTVSETFQLGRLSFLRNGLLRAPAQLGIDTTLKLLSAERTIHGLKNLARPNGPFTEGVQLAIRADLRGKGIGTSILEQGLNALDHPVLLVATNSEAVRLYERHGFRIVVQNGISGAFTAFVLRRDPQ